MKLFLILLAVLKVMHATEPGASKENLSFTATYAVASPFLPPSLAKTSVEIPSQDSRNPLTVRQAIDDMCNVLGAHFKVHPSSFTGIQLSYLDTVRSPEFVFPESQPQCHFFAVIRQYPVTVRCLISGSSKPVVVKLQPSLLKATTALGIASAVRQHLSETLGMGELEKINLKFADEFRAGDFILPNQAGRACDFLASTKSVLQKRNSASVDLRHLRDELVAHPAFTASQSLHAKASIALIISLMMVYFMLA